MYALFVRWAPQETRTFHVTSVTAERRSLFQVTATAELFLDTLFGYHRQEKFLLHAFVLMPEHFHVLCTPAPEVSLEKAVQFIKGGFSFRMKAGRSFWMHSFNETQIGSAEQFIACRRYIEENPVRRGLVAKAGAYPFSSASRGATDPMPEHFRAGALRA